MNDNPITRLLAWLQSIIFRKPAYTPIAPLFTIISEKRWDNGLLKQVRFDPARRPDAVVTFLFVPFRRQGQPPQPDCFICCDMFNGRGKRLATTHQVSVLLVPHFAKSLDNVKVIYSEPWDLQRGHYRNFHVLCIMQKIAYELMLETPERVDWHSAIGRARMECWGGLPVLSPPRPSSGDVFADPYDPGTRRVRVRLRWAMLWLAWLLVDG